MTKAEPETLTYRLCDRRMDPANGPPHRYEAAFQEAERLLERVGSLKH